MEDQSIREMINRIPTPEFANNGPPPVKGEVAAQALSKHFAPWVEPPSPAEVRQMAAQLAAEKLTMVPPMEPAQSAVPPYYKAVYDTQDRDLYDLEILMHGLRSWWEHAQMAVVEYMYRAMFKNDFDGDLRKAIAILERARVEYAKAPVTPQDRA